MLPKSARYHISRCTRAHNYPAIALENYPAMAHNYITTAHNYPATAIEENENGSIYSLGTSSIILYT